MYGMSSQTALTPPGNTATADHDAPRVLILGGDGYLGWPTALHLSRRGHQVGVVDSLCRRQYDVEMGVESLVPIATMERRGQAWTEGTGLAIAAHGGDMTDPALVATTLAGLRPAAGGEFA